MCVYSYPSCYLLRLLVRSIMTQIILVIIVQYTLYLLCSCDGFRWHKEVGLYPMYVAGFVGVIQRVPLHHISECPWGGTETRSCFKLQKSRYKIFFFDIETWSIKLTQNDLEVKHQTYRNRMDLSNCLMFSDCFRREITLYRVPWFLLSLVALKCTW